MILKMEDIMDEYMQMMKLFWTDFHIEVWNLNKGFTSFKCMDILAVITNIPNVIHFIKTKFTTSKFLNTIFDYLTFWFEKSNIIHTVLIPN